MDSPSAAETAGQAAPGSAEGTRSLWRTTRLWVVLLVVLVLAEAWTAITVSAGDGFSPNVSAYVPLALFLVPVLYAAITFGTVGGMVTAGVAAMASLPWAVLSDRKDDPVAAWAIAVQSVSLLVVAFFVGRAVTSERRIRQEAEASRAAHLAAEARYRDLFEANREPIVLVDPSGSVVEVNGAAVALFARAGRTLVGSELSQLVGLEPATSLLAGTDPELDSGPFELEGQGRFRPVVSGVEDVGGRSLFQIVFRDVTDEDVRRRRAEAYAADTLAGQEDERRRVAQELHDGPLQNLVHLGREIDETARQYRSVPTASSSAPLEDKLDELRSVVAGVGDEVRRISQGLRPPLLDDLGLVAALQRLCDETERRAAVATKLDVRGGADRLPPLVELVLYRITQEALSNVDRHAGAATVVVSLERRNQTTVLKVADDGSGFDAGGPGEGVGLGLTGMAERARLSGGRLLVQSTPGGGTVVRATIPDGGREREG
jgi:PAS domain S-box-containing protein